MNRLKFNEKLCYFIWGARNRSEAVFLVMCDPPMNEL